MGWFDHDDNVEQNAQRYDNYDHDNYQPHEASMFHEILAGGAAFAAAKAYEDHEAKNGKPSNHATAIEVMSGFAGAFIDREAETRGADYIDKERAKRQAREQIEQIPPEKFGFDQQGY